MLSEGVTMPGLKWSDPCIGTSELLLKHLGGGGPIAHCYALSGSTCTTTSVVTNNSDSNSLYVIHHSNYFVHYSDLVHRCTGC